MLIRGIYIILVLLTLLFSSGCELHSNITSAQDIQHEFSQTGGLFLPLTEKPVSLQVFTSTSSLDTQDLRIKEQNLFTQTVLALTGIEIKYLVAHQSNAADKLKAMYASKMIPDIADQSLSNEDFDHIISKNLVASIEDHYSIMPNLAGLYETDEQYRQALDQVREKHGKIYKILSYNLARDVNHGFLYRKDIFDRHGIKPWTNTSEFISNLRVLKSLYPDSHPFVSKRQFGIFNDISASWGLNGLNFYYDEKANQNLYGPIQPRFRELLDFFKGLYDEGLIDPHFLTSSQTDWERKMIEEESAFITYDWIDRMDQFQTAAKEDVPGYDLRFGYPVGPKEAYCKADKMGSISVYVTNNEKKNISLQLMDFFLSPAGMKLTSLGVEGESYQFDEKNQVRYLGFQEEELINIATLENKYGLFNQTFSLRFDKKSVYYQFSDRTQEAQEFVQGKNLQIPPFYPNKQIKNADKNGYTEIKRKLTSEAELFIGKYILSEKNTDETWKEWLEKAKDLGVDTLTQAYN